MIKRSNRTIIIKSNSLSMFSGLKNVFPYYSSYSLPLRVFRRVTRKFNITLFEPLLYGEWRTELEHTDLVILFDNNSEYADYIAHYIKKRNPAIRVVFWYWNPISFFKNEVVNSSFIDEIWTYNRFDAKRYNLNYNTQFYRPVIRNNNPPKPKNDMLFIGLDKGRKKILNAISEISESQGLICDFRIVQSKKDRVSYRDYVEAIYNTKCIVDLVPEQQCGLTLRPLEALFYNKKLITNYQDIVNYDFYNRSNVFIVGKDDLSSLPDFVSRPYKKIDKKIVDYYSFESWLNRIKNGEGLRA